MNPIKAQAKGDGWGEGHVHFHSKRATCSRNSFLAYQGWRPRR